MTRPQHIPGRPDDHRTRITLAVVNGLIAGATRALVDALLRHLTAGC